MHSRRRDETTADIADQALVFDTGSPSEQQRDSSRAPEARPAPEPDGDAQPPVVTGEAPPRPREPGVAHGTTPEDNER